MGGAWDEWEGHRMSGWDTGGVGGAQNEWVGCQFPH